MPKLTPEAAEDRRANILAAARECFVQRGINVSVDQICAVAGISKGAFYVHFKSKDAAIEALASSHTALLDSLATIADFEALKIQLFAYAHQGNVASSRLELEAWTHSLTQPGLRAVLQENIRHIRSALAQSLAASGVPDADAQQKATILQIFAIGIIATTALTDGDPKIELRAALDRTFSALESTA